MLDRLLTYAWKGPWRWITIIMISAWASSFSIATRFPDWTEAAGWFTALGSFTAFLVWGLWSEVKSEEASSDRH
jgi:hypothetical protein